MSLVRTFQAARREAISFTNAKPRLRVQLTSRRLDGPHRQLAPGLYANVVLEGENATWSVTPEMVETWKRDDVFEIALASSLAIVPLAFEVCVKGAHSPAFVALEGSGFTCAHALRLQERVPEISALGALVCVPTHHIVLVRPLDDGSALAAAKHLLGKAEQEHDASLNRVSRDMFWWREGVFERVALSHDGIIRTLQPSDELQRVLLQMPDEPNVA